MSDKKITNNMISTMSKQSLKTSKMRAVITRVLMDSDGKEA